MIEKFFPCFITPSVKSFCNINVTTKRLESLILHQERLQWRRWVLFIFQEWIYFKKICTIEYKHRYSNKFVSRYKIKCMILTISSWFHFSINCCGISFTVIIRIASCGSYLDSWRTSKMYCSPTPEHEVSIASVIGIPFCCCLLVKIALPTRLKSGYHPSTSTSGSHIFSSREVLYSCWAYAWSRHPGMSANSWNFKNYIFNSPQWIPKYLLCKGKVTKS